MPHRQVTIPTLLLTLISILLWLPSWAAAQLTDLGDSTLDEATGLVWLDLTKTTNLSYNAVAGGAGGWAAQGWRHATLAEVCQLFTSDAVAPASPCGSGDEPHPGDGVRALQALLGITRLLPDVADSFGFVDNATAGPSVGVAQLTYSRGAVSIANVETSSRIWNRDRRIAVVGNFLVRTNQPPVVDAGED